MWSKNKDTLVQFRAPLVKSWRQMTEVKLKPHRMDVDMIRQLSLWLWRWSPSAKSQVNTTSITILLLLNSFPKNSLKLSEPLPMDTAVTHGSLKKKKIMAD